MPIKYFKRWHYDLNRTLIRGGERFLQEFSSIWFTPIGEGCLFGKSAILSNQVFLEQLCSINDSGKIECWDIYENATLRIVNIFTLDYNIASLHIKV